MLQEGVLMILKKIIRKLVQKAQRIDSAIRPFAQGKWDYFMLALDYFYCRLFLRVSPEEYLLYNFPNLKNHYRKHFVLIQIIGIV